MYEAVRKPLHVCDRTGSAVTDVLSFVILPYGGGEIRYDGGGGGDGFGGRGTKIIVLKINILLTLRETITVRRS